jgi:hypothetical protein
LIPQARAILSRAERKSLEPPDDDEDLEAEIEREERRRAWLANHFEPENERSARNPGY